MLWDVSDVDWNAVSKLGLITGRCRWVAATIRELMDVVKSSTIAQRANEDFKTTALITAIDRVYTSWATKLASDLVAEVDKPHRFASDSVVTRLCKQLHAVSWLFRDQTQGMHLQCNGRDTSDMLALGLVLLVKAAPEEARQGRADDAASEVKMELDSCVARAQLPLHAPVLIGSQSTVTMDRIGKAAVESLAADKGWDASTHLAQAIAAATNANAIEFGYRFETLVAAALVRFDGTVADLIRDADPETYASDEGEQKRASKSVPRWTEDARFNCQYRLCTSSTETSEALEACWAADHPRR